MEETATGPKLNQQGDDDPAFIRRRAATRKSWITEGMLSWHGTPLVLTRVRTHKVGRWGVGASDVCFSPNSGAKPDIAGLRLWADAVEKVPFSTASVKR